MKLLDLAIRSRWSTLIERSPTSPIHELSEQDEDGLTVLHLACIHNQPVSTIRTLLRHNSYIENEDNDSVKLKVAARCVDSGGMSPLHCVCSFDHHNDGQGLGGESRSGTTSHQLDVVKELVYAYPDVLKLKDVWGWTPLHCLCARVVASASSAAEERGYGDIVTGDTARFGHYETSDSYSSTSNSEKEELSAVVKIAQILVEANPDAIQEPDLQNRTPLDLLCEVGGCLDQLLRSSLETSGLSFEERRQRICNTLMRGDHGGGGGSLSDLWLIVELIVRYSSPFQCGGEYLDNGKPFILHKVASMINTCPTMILHLMTLIHPHQASIKNGNGNLPFHLAAKCIQNGSRGESNGMFALLNVSPPGVLETCGIGNTCYPFILGRIANNGGAGFDDDRDVCKQIEAKARLGLLFRILKSKPELMDG